MRSKQKCSLLDALQLKIQPMQLCKHFDVGVIRAASSPVTSSDIIEVFYHPGWVCGRQFSNSIGVQKQAFGGLSRRKSTPTFGTVSLVSAPWSLFEVATDVLLFMQSKTTEATSRALCDPHSADLKVLLAAKFNRGQKYTEGMAVSSRQLILCSQSVKILTIHSKWISHWAFNMCHPWTNR